MQAGVLPSACKCTSVSNAIALNTQRTEASIQAGWATKSIPQALKGVINSVIFTFPSNSNATTFQ